MKIAIIQLLVAIAAFFVAVDAKPNFDPFGNFLSVSESMMTTASSFATASAGAVVA